MAHWFSDNSHSIGNTSLVCFSRKIYAVPAALPDKIESRNPASSVKCRIGAVMNKAAWQWGLLGNGKKLVDTANGNAGTALALAFVAAVVRDISINLAMSDTKRVKRYKQLIACFCVLVLGEAAKGIFAVIARVWKTATVLALFNAGERYPGSVGMFDVQGMAQ